MEIRLWSITINTTQPSDGINVIWRGCVMLIWYTNIITFLFTDDCCISVVKSLRADNTRIRCIVYRDISMIMSNYINTYSWKFFIKPAVKEKSIALDKPRIMWLISNYLKTYSWKITIKWAYENLFPTNTLKISDEIIIVSLK